jgi:DNA-binding transcriptional LysR family regulator
MDTVWLHDFVCLARTLNFTRAAEERSITQSAFSRRIRSLEAWAGGPLIDRGTYPLRLTPAGVEFLPVARGILLQLEQARLDLPSRAPGGAFATFAAPHSISVSHLAPMLGAMAKIHPEIRTHVISDNLHACCDALNEGACKFLLCYRNPRVPLTLDEQRFARVDLGVDRLTPVCAPASGGREPTWRLPGTRRVPTPYLAYAPGAFLGAVVETILADRRPALELRHVDAFAAALKARALDGAGVAWLPASHAAEELRRGNLVVAGGVIWEGQLDVTLYADVSRLEEDGQTVLRYFRSLARAPVPLPRPPGQGTRSA